MLILYRMLFRLHAFSALSDKSRFGQSSQPCYRATAALCLRAYIRAVFGICCTMRRLFCRYAPPSHNTLSCHCELLCKHNNIAPPLLCLWGARPLHKSLLPRKYILTSSTDSLYSFWHCIIADPFLSYTASHVPLRASGYSESCRTWHRVWAFFTVPGPPSSMVVSRSELLSRRHDNGILSLCFGVSMQSCILV